MSSNCSINVFIVLFYRHFHNEINEFDFDDSDAETISVRSSRSDSEEGDDLTETPITEPRSSGNAHYPNWTHHFVEESLEKNYKKNHGLIEELRDLDSPTP